MKGTEIDTTDIPPALDWSQAVVGKFYRPIKKPLTIRLDADVLAWRKGQGGYQTRINELLRRAIENAGQKRKSGWLLRGLRRLLHLARFHRRHFMKNGLVDRFHG